MAELNDQGRRENAAQPLGDQKGIESPKAEKKTGEREVTRQDGFLNREGDPAEGRPR